MADLGSALRKLQLDLSRGTLRAWVAAVARHLACRHARRRSAYHDEELSPELAAALLDPEGDPATEYERAERIALVAAALAEVGSRLPALSRRVLVLRWIEGASVPEIALAVGFSEGLVKMRLHRACRELRALLLRRGLGGP